MKQIVANIEEQARADFAASGGVSGGAGGGQSGSSHSYSRTYRTTSGGQGKLVDDHRCRRYTLLNAPLSCS